MSDDRKITMVLHNWARREQMTKVIDSLLMQKEKPVIFVWNNAPEPFVDDRVDWVINSSRNAHVRPVISMWQMAWTPYVGRIDDDLYLGDDEILGDALTVAKGLRHNTQILGAYGVKMYTGETYESSHHMNACKGHGQIDPKTDKPSPKVLDYAVDIVKGRFMLLRQEATHRMTPGFGHVHTDLHINTSLAERRRFHHCVSGVFWERTSLEDKELCKPRLVDFELDEKGYCAKPDHMAERNALAQAWVAQCLPDRRARSKPKDKKRDSSTGATTPDDEGADG